MIVNTNTGEILDLRALSRPPRARRTRRKSARFTNTNSVTANSWGMVTLFTSGLALAVALVK